MKFFICGFTGAGKSTVLNQLKTTDLAESFQISDLDQMVLEKLPGFTSIADFIIKKGFDEFRKLEYQNLVKISKLDHQIVALGGGAFNSLTEDVLAGFEGIWLDTAFNVCWERISGDESRPIGLLDRNESLSLYNQRVNYFKTAYRASSYSEIYNYILKQLGNFT